MFAVSPVFADSKNCADSKKYGEMSARPAPEWFFLMDSEYGADAEAYIPVAFWKLASERFEKIKPDIAIATESSRTKYQIKTYDVNYGFIIRHI